MSSLTSLGLAFQHDYCRRQVDFVGQAQVSLSHPQRPRARFRLSRQPQIGSLSFRTDHFNLPEGDSPSPPRTKGLKARLLGREPSGQRALAIRSPSTGRDLGRCKDKLFESPVPLAQGPRDPLDRHDVQPDTQDQGAKSPKAGS